MKALDFTRERLVAPLRDRGMLADVERLDGRVRPEDEAEDLLTTRRERDELAAIRADDDHEDLADAPPPGWARPELDRYGARSRARGERT